MSPAHSVGDASPTDGSASPSSGIHRLEDYLTLTTPSPRIDQSKFKMFKVYKDILYKDILFIYIK